MKEFHPIAELFPLIEGEEYERFVQSVKEFGRLLYPITLLDGQVLEGRNRERACQDTGVTPRYETLPAGEDPYAFVAAANLHRRHLTKSQAAQIAEKMITMKHGGDRKSNQVAKMQLDSKSTNEVAKIMGVCSRMVGHVRRVKRDAVPEVIAAMEQEKIGVATADDIAALPRDKQTAALAEQTVRRRKRTTTLPPAEETRRQELKERSKQSIPWPEGADARPVHPDGEIRTQQIRDAIVRLRKAEPQIGQMPLGYALRDVFSDAKKIHFFEGPIDPAVKTWCHEVAGKARTRELLLEAARQKRSDAEVDQQNKQHAKRQHKIHGFEAAWMRFEQALKAALKKSVFCLDDESSLKAATTECLEIYFEALRQKAAKPGRVNATSH